MIQKSTRIFLFLLVIALIFSTFSSGSVSAEQQVFDEQVLIVSYKDRDQLADLAKRYDVVEVDSETQTVKIFSNQITRDALAAEGFTWTVDLPYTALINAEVKPLFGQITGIPGYPCYRTVAEVYASADTLAADYPALVELIDIGDSWEKTQNANAGWDIEVLVLGNRNTPSVPKSDAFIMSGIHAREWAPPELNLRLAEYLLANYQTNADVKWLLDYNRIHLVLLTNPDGRVKDEANQDEWRKNTNNNYCGNTNSRGADLNRNYSYQWELISGECGETYSGPSAGSEPETEAITSYVASVFPDQKGPNPTDPVNELNATGIFIDLHSYSELVLWPWGYTDEQAPNYSSLRVMSYKFAYYNGYLPQQSESLYATTGTTDDWAYGELGVPGFCFEVGPYPFYQSCSLFENEINPDNQQALLRAIKIARKPYRLAYGPEMTNLSVSPNPVELEQNLVVNYTANDTFFSSYGSGVPSQNIISVKYSIDKPSWIAGSGWQIVPVNASSPIYSGTFTASTAGLSSGQHTIFVESADGSGLWGPPTAIFFTISNGDAPVAAADTYATDEDVELVVALAEGVLANDVDDGPMTAVLETDVTNGTLVLAADGSFTYMPDANFFSEDSFTYKAFDGELYSNTVSVTITVNPINDAPVTIADAYSTDQDIELVVEAPGVLTNDTDIDEDDLIAELETDADNGTLSLAADGSFTYMPDAGFFGEDNFTYKSYDGELYSEVVTVTITVNEVVPDVFNIYLPLMLK